MKATFLIIALFHSVCGFQVFASPELSRARAHKMFERLTGVPLIPGDARIAFMEKLITDSKSKEAAKIATDDKGFYDTTLKDFAAALSNKEETPLVELDDFQAMFVGITRDDLDGRLLLSGDFRYEAKDTYGFSDVGLQDNDHYLEIESERLSLKTALVKHSPQWDGVSESAGALTSRAWGKAHLSAGTNRRATEYAFREFLCTPISTWKDVGLPDFRVRRDVERRPSGDAATYQLMCRSCHAPMDGLTGAFANWDYVGEKLTFRGTFGVSQKMNQNNHVYPDGYSTADSTWVNLATKNHNESFGWRGALEGMGVKEFGAMLANSKAFSRCMVSRAYKKVCHQDLAPTGTSNLLEGLADEFEKGGYKFRSLFEAVASDSSFFGAVL